MKMKERLRLFDRTDLLDQQFFDRQLSSILQAVKNESSSDQELQRRYRSLRAFVHAPEAEATGLMLYKVRKNEE